jgi:superfamily I DNA and/or RNA helicase
MVEPLSLMPLTRSGCSRLVLVGDPQQLPPTLAHAETVPSPDTNMGYVEADGCRQLTNLLSCLTDRSLARALFSRLALCDSSLAPLMLRTQYRLHPALSSLSNFLFYKGMLRDGVKAEERLPIVPEMPTLWVLNVACGTESRTKGNSYTNSDEALVVDRVVKLVQEHVEAENVGVISLYKAQAYRILDSVKATGVQVSTVDAFQGAEKEVIVLSTVRTARLGFIESPERLNVALTRAKRHLVLVGHVAALSASNMWRALLERCRLAGGVLTVVHDARRWSLPRLHLSPPEEEVDEEAEAVLDELFDEI